MDRLKLRRAPQGTALVAALVVACAYAAFAHGATRFPEETRLQVLVAAAVLFAVIAGGVRFTAVPYGRLGVTLLAAFAVWTGLTLLWSVAPDRTWLEVNRAIAYALVAGLGLAAGASAERPLVRFAAGWLVAATAAALFAFGGKALPGVNVPGLFDLNHTRTVARLRAPLDYWNALALVCAMAVPVAVRVVATASVRLRWRLGALACLFFLLAVVGMTYSRGGIVAVVVAVAVLTAVGPDRLRGLLVVVATLCAVAPVLVVAFAKRDLTTNAADLTFRIIAGRTLLATTIVCLGALLVGAWFVVRRVEGVAASQWTAAASRQVWRGLAVAGCLALLGGTVYLASTADGVTGSVVEVVEDFTATQQDNQFDPDRLVSTNSGNRWVWWMEAVGAWADRPLGGWGAGSFPVTHLLYRDDLVPVAQPHSVPLQWLAETGLVGFLLAAGGIGVLLLAGARRAFALPFRSEDRAFAGALLAAGFGWVAHGLYDWDWDIPGVTVPVMAMLGLLVGSRGAAVRSSERVFDDPEASVRPRYGLALVATLLLCGVVASAVLPSWSASKAQSAQERLGADDVSEEDVRLAAAEARVAARLDPLAVRPLFVSAAIAQRRGQLLEARDLLLEAVDRQPFNADAWSRLASIAVLLADRTGFERAASRALSLDPMNPALARQAGRAQQFLAPVGSSATAVGTPLPTAPVAADPAAPAVPPAPPAPPLP